MTVSARTQSALRRFLVFALPSLVTLGRFQNGFVFDDVFVIERGEFIHKLANLPRAFLAHAMIASSQEHAVGRPSMDTYRPISIGSFFWDSALSGKEVWSYHLTNLVLHGLVCVLVLQLLDALVPQVAPRIRFCMACWFGLAPWLAEAHVFINGRSDLLLALFFLCALLAFRMALSCGRFGWVAGLCMLLALLSKEVAVMLLPFVLAVPTQSSRGWRRRLLVGWPVLVALALYLGLRNHALSGLRSHSDGAQLLLALRHLPLLLWDGLAHALAPSPYVLRSLRDDYAGLGIAPLLVGSALLLAVCVRLLLRLHRHYTLAWALFMALSALAPAAMISTVLWPGFGRYLYVPAIGLCLALGLGIEAAVRRSQLVQRLWLPAGTLVLAASSGLLFDATLGFRDEPTMYGRALAHSPTQAWTHGFLGMSLRRAGDCDAAIAPLNIAATMDPADPRYAIHLGRCLVDTGAYTPAFGVAERGRARFRDTRSESGFLLIGALALPASRNLERERLLDRCLALDNGRSDCRDLLQQLRARRQPP